MSNRKARLVRPDIQFKFLGVIVLSMLAPVVVIAGGVYYVIAFAASHGLEVNPETVQTIMPAVVLVVWFMFALMAVTAMWLVKMGLSISHKYVGPLERLERELTQIGDPPLSYRLSCRPGDVISPIVDPVNRLLDSVEQRVKKHLQDPPLSSN